MALSIEDKKRIVREFYDLAFNQKQPEEAVKRYLGPTYRQHNPLAGDGAEPFIGFVHWITRANPELRIDIKRMVAEGDLVVVHSHQRPAPAARGKAVMDIFRLDNNGKIVEHWDVLQDVPEKAENANTMF
jgi:predicted SnoaL-like aldol condensation-catalyzing enzyme